MSALLTEADNRFFLGLYRNAVSLYQPRIEKRTGVSLGSIGVRDFRQFDEDRMRDLKQIKHPWLLRIFGRPAIKAYEHGWHEYLESTHTERARKCMASYYRNTIYASFAHDSQCHEEGFAFTAVHELAHALWEKIEGEPLDTSRAGTKEEREKFHMLVEGHAAYAEQIWFRDLYPRCIQKRAWRCDYPRQSKYYQGRQRIAELVKQVGPDVLMEIPKRWRSL